MRTLPKMKYKGYKGSGKLFIMIPVQELKKIPPYFFIELDLKKITDRKKDLSYPEQFSKFCVSSLRPKKTAGETR